MKRIMKTFGELTVLTTDKAPAFNKLREQDHRHVKRRFAKSRGFQIIRHASRTLKGIETVHALYKRKRGL